MTGRGRKRRTPNWWKSTAAWDKALLSAGPTMVSHKVWFCSKWHWRIGSYHPQVHVQWVFGNSKLLLQKQFTTKVNPDESAEAASVCALCHSLVTASMNTRSSMKCWVASRVLCGVFECLYSLWSLHKTYGLDKLCLPCKKYTRLVQYPYHNKLGILSFICGSYHRWQMRCRIHRWCSRLLKTLRNIALGRCKGTLWISIQSRSLSPRAFFISRLSLMMPPVHQQHYGGKWMSELLKHSLKLILQG